MTMQPIKRKQSCFFIACLGLLAGITTRLTDFLPNGGVWGFQAIATLFGFWMLSVTLIVYNSSSNIRAAIEVFLFLFCMTCSFYGLKWLLGLFLPQFESESFSWNLLILYTILSLLCAAGGFILYFWNRKNIFSSFLYALPIGGLAAEALATGIFLCKHHTYLFQLLFDFISMAVLGRLFYKKAACKPLYVSAAVVSAWIIYALIYRPFLI